MTKRKVVNYAVNMSFSNEVGYSLRRRGTWSYEDEAKLIMLRNEGKTFDEIAEILNRRSNAVKMKYKRMAEEGFIRAPRVGKKGEDTKVSTFEDRGCQYFPKCAECGFPACIEDGYSPARAKEAEAKSKRKSKRKPKIKTKKWSSEEVTRLHQLLKTKINIPTLANIFNCTIDEVGSKIREINHVK